MISGLSLCRLVCAARKACSGVPPWAMTRPRKRATQRPAYGEPAACESSCIVINTQSSNGEPMWKSRRRLVFFQIDNAHKRQVTVILIEVKPEPKDKLIWN